MDPNSKDLIVWLQRAAGSLLTDTNDVLFQPITNLAAPPGLGSLCTSTVLISSAPPRIAR